MDIKQNLYNNLPYQIQVRLFNSHCGLLYKKRYTEKFFEKLEQLNESQWLSFSQLVEYQSEKLCKLIKHAYETVPYYHRVMKENKLVPQDFKTIDDLPKMPLLTRNDVHRYGKELVSRKFSNKDLVSGHTSGTTGSPLNFWWDYDMWFLNNVFDWRQKNWAGLSLGDPYGVLLGRTIVALTKKNPPFWQHNKFENQCWLSSFHLSKDTIGDYLSFLEDVQVVALEGYPSTLYILAQLSRDIGKKIPLRSTLTSSETLFHHQKEAIKSTFDCENFDYYGLAERVIWATECDKHMGKHLSMEYGVTEVVDASGNVLPQGDTGFLVGTSLINYGMPFIRYKTTDISSISLKPCSCGRQLPLMGDVTTKAEDLIYTPSGKYISSSTLTHPFKPLHHIEMSQIVQERADLITIKIVKRPGYSEEDSRRLIHDFTKRVGSDIDVQIKFVERLPREKSGKFKWVVSKLDMTELSVPIL